MLKVGLVGVGGISGAHIPAWERMEDTELVALCDVRPERMEQFADKHCYTDFDEMLEKEQLDILDICLPTYMHADFAVKAMNQGVNVLTEKPISLKKEDVKRVYETAECNHVTFMVAQVVRFWPEYEYLKKVYDSGEYGALLSGSMQRLGSFPGWSWDNWMQDEKRSGLVSYDLHIHDLDFLVYTFGKPDKVYNFRCKRPDQDSLHEVYAYDNFTIAADAAWYGANFAFHSSFRFQFEKAVVEYENQVLTVYLPDAEAIHPLDGQTAGDTGEIDLPDTDAYGNEIRYFTDCVKAHKQADRVRPEELETVISILNSL